MTEHGGNSRIIHSRVGYLTHLDRKIAEPERHVDLPVTCERPSRDYMRGFMTKRRDATREETVSLFQTWQQNSSAYTNLLLQQ
jgi:hypothetical protein